MTLRRAGQKRGVVLLTRSKEDECPSVSLDLSCDSSSVDSDDCATRDEKVSDLVLPHILGVSPCRYVRMAAPSGCLPGRKKCDAINGCAQAGASIDSLLLVTDRISRFRA